MSNLIHISLAGPTYQYKTITFEWHKFCGPIFLNRRNGKERSWRNVSVRNYADLDKWLNLSKEDREQYLIKEI